MRKPIMVVEDDPDIQESLVELLGLMGRDAVTARDGQEALQLLRQIELPSLILLDLSMPRMDGTAFRAKQLADASLAKVPVVLISADAELHEKASTLKVAAFIRKPIDPELLTIALAGCRARRAAAATEGRPDLRAH